MTLLTPCHLLPSKSSNPACPPFLGTETCPWEQAQQAGLQDITEIWCDSNLCCVFGFFAREFCPCNPAKPPLSFSAKLQLPHEHAFTVICSQTARFCMEATQTHMHSVPICLLPSSRAAAHSWGQRSITSIKCSRHLLCALIPGPRRPVCVYT